MIVKQPPPTGVTQNETCITNMLLFPKVGEPTYILFSIIVGKWKLKLPFSGESVMNFRTELAIKLPLILEQ